MARMGVRRDRRRGGSAAHVERGGPALHDLVGAGSSQLGLSAALRGRDVNRPSAADLADAERDLVIVRRHWSPPGS